MNLGEKWCGNWSLWIAADIEFNHNLLNRTNQLCQIK